MPERHPPDDPREWLNRAQSDLLLAKSHGEGIYLEDLCFYAQQAAEKAIKALLIRRGVEFPYVHDIAELLTLLEWSGVRLPESVKKVRGTYPVCSYHPIPRRSTPGQPGGI